MVHPFESRFFQLMFRPDYGRVVKATDSNSMNMLTRYLFSSEAQVQVLLVSILLLVFGTRQMDIQCYFYMDR